MKDKKRFGVMLDTSRNAVMKISQIKKLVDILFKFGYNTLLLYMEDTYTIDSRPYFGYMRGRYSVEELKEIDDYCLKKGVEVIPCIQTLGHLGTIFNWQAHRKYRDVNDILMVDDQDVYCLISDMIDSIKNCFSSKLIHIGMDEAHYLGRGKYLDKNGYNDPKDLFKRHLNKVLSIVAEKGLTPLIWSDMPFRIANNGEYYPKGEIKFTDVLEPKYKENLNFVYWDYEHFNVEHYKKMISAHENLCDKNNLWFAGGAWSWIGFTPANKFSIDTLVASMTACSKCDVSNVFITLWGNNGKECSFYALLPSLFFAKKCYDGVTDLDIIKKEFMQLVGVEYELMLSLDRPNLICGNKDACRNPSEYVFYGDLFNSYITPSLPIGGEGEYLKVAESLELGINTEFGYIFDTLSKLCKVLSIKYCLPKHIRFAYENKDLRELKCLVDKIKNCESSVEKFYCAFKNLWETENKPYGFEIQDYRIGGMLKRMEHCRKRLEDYISGSIDKIEELEEPLLPFMENHNEKEVEFTCIPNWKSAISANIL